LWPSGTGATNILPIRLYKSPHDLHTHTFLLNTAVQLCDVEGYPPKSPSIGNMHSQFLSRAPKFNRLKEKHTLKHMVYLNKNAAF